MVEIESDGDQFVVRIGRPMRDRLAGVVLLVTGLQVMHLGLVGGFAAGVLLTGGGSILGYRTDDTMAMLLSAFCAVFGGVLLFTALAVLFVSDLST